MWKFGLLGRDFHYRVFEPPAGRTLWSRPRRPADAVATIPRSGSASMVCNVIDTRQAYLQKLLKQALAALGFEEQARRSVHYSYEMVALTHSTARELGYDAADDTGKPFVEVSGRKGLGVKADDLLDRLIGKASGEVARAQHRTGRWTTCARTAEAIAIAAVRYFMVKFSRGKVIAFDIDEALSFEGESGPYLQYAVVRANNIFAQAEGPRRPGRRGGARARCPAISRRTPIADGSDDQRRALGARARGGAARRGRRSGGADARAVGAREVRLRAGAAVQRLLPLVSRF